MKVLEKFMAFGKKFIVKVKNTCGKEFVWNFFVKGNFMYIQIYDRDNILVWNKKLEWLGHGFREVD